MTFHITVNLDEISDKLDDSLKFLNRLSIKSCELRMINTKNIIQLSDAELIKKNGYKSIISLQFQLQAHFLNGI